METEKKGECQVARRYKLKEAKVRLVLNEGNEALYSAKPLTNPERAIEAVVEFLKNLDREHVVVINLNTQNKPINYHIVSVGTINQSTFDCGNIFKTALLSNAAQIIMLHNHPSGDIDASRADLLATETVISAGKILNIPCIDHIIVGGGRGVYNSLAETTSLFD